jgi:hypothetical protein
MPTMKRAKALLVALPLGIDTGKVSSTGRRAGLICLTICISADFFLTGTVIGRGANCGVRAGMALMQPPQFAQLREAAQMLRVNFRKFQTQMQSLRRELKVSTKVCHPVQ